MLTLLEQQLVFTKFLIHEFMLCLARGKLGTGRLDTVQGGGKLYHYVNHFYYPTNALNYTKLRG